MKKRYWLWLAGGILLLTALLIIGQYWLRLAHTADPITKEEAQKLVLERYPGKITSVVLKNEQFVVEMVRETGAYQVELDSTTGEINSLRRTERPADKKPLNEEEVKNIIAKNIPGALESISRVNDGEKLLYKAIVKESDQQKSITVDGLSGEIIASELVEKKEPVKRLAEQDAVQIAIKEVGGEVDDVSLENVSGASYYFVEVETNEGQEAIVQINAITGEVKSLTWDD